MENGLWYDNTSLSQKPIDPRDLAIKIRQRLSALGTVLIVCKAIEDESRCISETPVLAAAAAGPVRTRRRRNGEAWQRAVAWPNSSHQFCLRPSLQQKFSQEQVG